MVHTINMTYPCWYWPWSPGWGSIYRIFPPWSSSSPPFPYCTLWKEVTAWSPRLGYESVVMLPLPWGWSIYVQYLEFFFRGDLSLLAHLCVCLIIYLYQCRFIDIISYLGYNFCCCCCYCLNCFSLGRWELFQLAPGLLDIPFTVDSWPVPYSLPLTGAPGSSCIFPALVLELAISPRNPGSFCRKIVFETKTCVPDKVLLGCQGHYF